MTGFGELGVALAFVASFGGLGEVSGEWAHEVNHDAFTDELTWAGAVTLDVVFDGNDEVAGGIFTLLVACEPHELPIAGIGGGLLRSLVDAYSRLGGVLQCLVGSRSDSGRGLVFACRPSRAFRQRGADDASIHGPRRCFGFERPAGACLSEGAG